MRGPNYWSADVHKLIVARLDLSECENFPEDKSNNFFLDLKARFPMLFNEEMDISSVIKEEGWIANTFVHLAIRVQQMAGAACSFTTVFPTSETGVYNAAFEYTEEAAGEKTAGVVFDLCNAVLNGKPYNVEPAIETIASIIEKVQLGPSTKAIVNAAALQGIPYKRMDCGSFVRFGYGVFQKRIQSSVSDTTSSIAVDVASDKHATKELLERAVLPIPQGIIVRDESELRNATMSLDFPLVVKPIDGNHGRGITTHINSHEAIVKAYHLAKKESNEVIVEQFVEGDDYRFLVINYKLVAVAKRTPAMVTGNGKSTIQELIDQENSDPRRGEGHNKELTKIEVDAITRKILEENKLTLDSILPENKILFLKDTANISTGGTATDVTEKVHPENKFIAERVARVIGLDICGIDIMATDVETPFRENGGKIIEVNAGPGLRMHVSPSMGNSRKVGEAVVELLYPSGGNARIPIVAITGTNGKTTTTRLTAHMAKQAGYNVGYTVTDGIYIGDHNIEFGDCTGSKSAEVILTDPTVDFAVLECARGGILRYGLGFDQCDIGIVTNIADDHLGLNDINSIEDMARAKSVVPKTVHKEGYAILNAEDDLVYAMRSEVKGNVALFALNASNPRIVAHCSDGGLAAVVDKGCILILDGTLRIEVEKVDNIPLTMKGKATFMTQNVLPALLTCYIKKVPLKDIRVGLMTFHPSAEQTPGRLNLFSFPDFDVIVDYAHNTHSYKALGKFLANIRNQHKVGVVAAVGDRRDEDLKNVGRIAANMFDEIVIRQDKDLRGRTEDEIVKLIKQGIEQVAEKPVSSVPNELDAIRFAMKKAKKNSLIVVCTDMVKEVLSFVKAEQGKYQHEGHLTD